MSTFEKPVCPECGSDKIIPILYGLPRPELVRKAVFGKVILGGCVVHENGPDLFCCSCGARWERMGARSSIED